MADTVNNNLNSYRQKKNHIRLAKADMSKGLILDSAQAKAAAAGVEIKSLGATPTNLFGAGDAGVFYQISDLNTLYQTTSGITLAGVGDPVGLVLDKSKGGALGAEQLTNVGFDTDTDWGLGTGWSISDGKARSAGGNNVTDITQAFDGAGNLGKQVLVTFEVSDYVAGSVRPGFTGDGGNAGTFVSANGTYREVFTIGGSYTTFRFLGAGGGLEGSIDNVSLKEILGNHCVQPTAAARPILRQNGAGLYYLDFDGIDDWLPVTTTGLLGQNYAHVGGWRGVSGLRYYATTQVFQSSPRHLSGNVQMFNSANTFVNIAAVADLTDFVMTIEKASTVSLAARANGVDGTPIIPWDDSASSLPGLAIGSQGTGAFANGFSGFFFGGVWIDRDLTASERADTEAYFADLTGVTL